MSRILVIAPHPDDETLGCGGTLLRHRQDGDDVHWLIVTAMLPEFGYTEEMIAERRREIAAVAGVYKFTATHELCLPTTRLDTLPEADTVKKLGDAINNIEPEILYIPFSGDAHGDHQVVFHAAMACSKWFRYPSIQRILAYETLSETEFGIDPRHAGFHPNVFVDIGACLDGKIAAMRHYRSELHPSPFPRSEETIRALAVYRGSHVGYAAAEAFMLLRERR